LFASFISTIQRISEEADICSAGFIQVTIAVSWSIKDKTFWKNQRFMFVFICWIFSAPQVVLHRFTLFPHTSQLCAISSSFQINKLTQAAIAAQFNIF
jgi:hypothetical protein